MLDIKLGTHQNISLSGWQIAGTTAALVVASLFYLTWLRPRFFPKIRGVPGPPLEGWLLGHFREMLRQEPERALLQWNEQYGKEKGAFRVVSAVGLERLVVTRYSILKQILVKRPYEFPKPAVARKILQSVVGEGLLTFEDKAHRDLRMYMNKAFSPKHLQAQYEMYHGPVQNFLKIIKAQVEKDGGKTTMDMYAWSSRCLLDIIGLAAFGITIDSLHNDASPLGVAYHDLVSQQTTENLATMMFIMNIPLNLGSGAIGFLSSKSWGYSVVSGFVKGLTKIGLGKIFGEFEELAIFVRSMFTISKIAEQLREEKTAEALKLGPEGVDHGKVDVLSLLISASLFDEEVGSSYKMDGEMVKNSMLTILGAGHETTASGVTWTTYLLAKHPEVQDKLRKECQDLLRVYENPPFDKLKELKYLNAVVKESLRVEPPVPATIRQAKQDSVVDDILIKKGTMIFIPNLVVNQDIHGPWGADAKEFRPERWFELPEGYDPSMSLLTFIAGAHQCIAKTMAQTEMALLTCMLVANFKFELAEGQTVRREASITMRPVGGMPLLISKAPSPPIAAV
ncbi:hypothetical protein OC846_003399 [Tilletia horrida]|uniref:Cytochrome P450 n=1 Tax=Tilletia horrida TaxID=155126 RepID=A0AAN6GPT8_9BASI|nr:hypothetical protein OC845_003224 [Tilletia horrida]KAK0551159.1 hypothetical protein OC846_003399 [Tilletia horrida]KAK0566108.1 hypothetical protein OC861_003402 [Tilletia horrida]